MFKKFLSSILTVVFVMSMIPAAYAEQPRAGKTLKDFYSSLSFSGMSGGSFGGGAGRGFGGGLTIKGAGAGRETGSSFGGGAGRGDWGSGFNKNYGLTFTGSGAKNNFQYNDISSVTNITIANTTNNTFYNPVTNNYNTYNNISYNNAFNTYYMEGDKYNSYITNNATYISYYVIDNSVQETYYYEIYYQLPDGRNSYDLEPEDVWGTYFIYNATNYREVLEDDGITRGLWHMDGNYKDSSAAGVGDLSSSQIDFISDGMGSAARLSSGTSSSISFPSGVDRSSPYTVEFRFKVTSLGDLPSKKIVRESSLYRRLTYTYTGIEECYFTGLFSTAGNRMDCSVGVWYNVAVCYDGSGYCWFLNGKKLGLNYTVFNFNLSNTMSISYKYTCESYMNIPNTTPSTEYFTGAEVYKDRRVSVLYDEVRLSNKVLYTENYTPRTQPFDTNKVLVVPDPAGMTDTTIAVKSSVPVGALRVGGVRPTFPGNGDVYVVEEKGIVKDVQQFQQDGWYSVQASLYIDGEWKLFVGFDISGFGLNKPDSPGGGTGPGGSGDSGGSGSGGGGSGGGDSGGSSGFWDKLLQSTFGGVLSVLASLLSGLLTLLGAILTMLLGIVGYISIFLPFLPGSIVTLIGGGVFIVLALVVIKFIGGLL